MHAYADLLLLLLMMIGTFNTIYTETCENLHGFRPYAYTTSHPVFDVGNLGGFVRMPGLSNNRVLLNRKGENGGLSTIDVNTGSATIIPIPGLINWHHFHSSPVIRSYVAPGTETFKILLLDFHLAKIIALDVITGIMSTVAGSGQIGAQDGDASTASFNFPENMLGNRNLPLTDVYVNDAGNKKIRWIDLSSNTVRTLAGGGNRGFVDEVGTRAEFRNPTSMCISPDDSKLFIADSAEIRMIVIATGAVTTIAGQNQLPGYANGIGVNARFAENIAGLSTDLVGDRLFISDTNNYAIRVVDLSTTDYRVSTVAGADEDRLKTTHDVVEFNKSHDGVGTAARFKAMGPMIITSDASTLIAIEIQSPFTVRLVNVENCPSACRHGFSKKVAGSEVNCRAIENCGFMEYASGLQYNYNFCDFSFAPKFTANVDLFNDRVHYTEDRPWRNDARPILIYFMSDGNWLMGIKLGEAWGFAYKWQADMQAPLRGWNEWCNGGWIEQNTSVVSVVCSPCPPNTYYYNSDRNQACIACQEGSTYKSSTRQCICPTDKGYVDVVVTGNMCGRVISYDFYATFQMYNGKPVYATSDLAVFIYYSNGPWQMSSELGLRTEYIDSMGNLRRVATSFGVIMTDFPPTTEWEQKCESDTPTAYTESFKVETERCRSCSADMELKLHSNYSNLLPVCQQCMHGTILRRDGTRVCACKSDQGYIDFLFIGNGCRENQVPRNFYKTQGIWNGRPIFVSQNHDAFLFMDRDTIWYMNNEVRHIQEDNWGSVEYMAASSGSYSNDPMMPPTKGWFFTCGDRSNIKVEVELGACRTCSSNQSLGLHDSLIHNSLVCRGNCSAGFTQSSQFVCTRCVAGKYKVSSGDMACTDCPPNSNSLAGSTACTCNSGTFQNNNSFVRLIGVFCGRSIEEDFFQTPLEFLKMPTYTANTILGPRYMYHVPGFLGSKRWSISSDFKQHSASTQRLQAISTDVDVPRTVWEEWCGSEWKTARVQIRYNVSCSVCPLHSHSSKNIALSTVVTRCDCDSGSSGPNGQAPCVLCEIGRHKQGITINNTCVECENGKFSKVGSVKCEECRVGKYLNASYECQECAAGKYLNTSKQCHECPTGKYLTASDECQDCPITYSAAALSTAWQNQLFTLGCIYISPE